MGNIRAPATPGQRVIATMFRVFASFHYPIAVRRVKYTGYFLHASHHHDFPQVWYCLSGTYRHAVGDKEYICRPGSVVTAPPGVFHGYEISGEEEVELICLEGTFFFFSDMKEPHRTSIITNMFCSEFEHELGFAPKHFLELPEEEKKRADELLLVLCREDFKRKVLDISRVRRKIGEFYSLPSFELTDAQTMITFSTFSFSYIADHCGFGSRTYMGKLFKKTYGLTLQEERKKRNRLVKQFPNSIMTHEFWETIKIE